MRTRRIAVTALAIASATVGGAAAAKKKHHGGKPHHAAPAAKHAPADKPAGADAPGEAVEEVEAVEAVDAAAAGEKAGEPGAALPAKGALGLSDTLGHLHAAVVHMPIAWSILLFLVDAAALWAGRRELLAAGLYLAPLTALSFAPAVVTGLVRFGQLPQDPENAAPALVHRNFMYACAALALLATGLRLWRRNRLEGPTRLAYSAAVALLLLLTAWGAHLGGKLVYGDDFLPF